MLSAATTSRVLIIEDEPEVRELLRVVLRNVATRIDEARDGTEAIDLLSASTYDFVILDIMLPRRNGFEVAEHIRHLPYRPRLIVLSAISRYFADRFPEDTVVLQKPFGANELTRVIRGAMDSRPSSSDTPHAATPEFHRTEPKPRDLYSSG